MKFAMKSALIKLTVAGLCLWLPMACTDDGTPKVPHVFGSNEVPPDILNEPRLVTSAAPNASAKAAWPLLGNVPSKPKDFTPLPMIDQTKGELETDRAVAAQKLYDVENPPVTMPPRAATVSSGSLGTLPVASAPMP